MTDLITRLSKLDGPRYTMDVAIALATDFWPKDRIQNIVYNDDGDPWIYFTDGPDLPLPPAYTASVDAAIALAERLLPESVARRLIIFNSSPAKAGFDGTPERGKLFYYEAATPAIAACIALLRAKEASKL